jgi:GTP:adenosylcobinamide-phosphate guanylyltransferase
MNERIMKSCAVKYDTILLAGDTGASRKVCGRNKSFLEIDGVPLFLYVLKSLKKAENINRICLVGPKERLNRAIENHQHFLENINDVAILEQGDSLYSNAWKSFLHLYPEARDIASNKSVDPEKAVFCIPGDIPLVTPLEIDAFVNLCDVDRYDYFLGITPAESLRYFHPQKGRPGIKINYFYLKEGKYRQNNLHLIKPLKVKNRHYIQKVYDYRYQRDLKNIVKMAIEFIKVHVGLEGFWCYSLLHWNQLLSRMHLDLLTLPTRQLLPLSFIESCVSRVLGTRFTNVVSSSAGAVLDIDNEKDYRIMCEMFLPWGDYQRQQEETLKTKHEQIRFNSVSRHDAA